MPRCFLILLLLSAGCRNKAVSPEETGTLDTEPPGDTGPAGSDTGGVETGGGDEDADGDGFLSTEDCDDTDASVFPGAEEVAYDGVDQDCDGEDLTDVDGDGYDSDVVGGSDCDDTDPGVRPGVYDLPEDGIDQNCDGEDNLRVQQALDISSADVAWEGPTSSYFFGSTVLLGLDASGDGVGDVIIGDKEYGPGGVYFYEGAEEGVSVEYYALLGGEEQDDMLGSSLALAGDVNGDGYPDLWVGTEGGPYPVAPYANRFYLVEGPVPEGFQSIRQGAAATILGDDVSVHLGFDLSGNADTNGDGVPDVLVTGYLTYPYLITRTDSLNGDEALEEVYSSRFGAASLAAFIGDINADGFEDVLTSYIYLEGFEGYTLAYLGPFSGDYDLEDADIAVAGPPEDAGGSGSSHYLGAVGRAGDVNGDGYDDLLISAAGYTKNSEETSGVGGAYLMFGGDLEDRSVQEADATYIPSDDTWWLGSSIDSGDFDGDGRPDIALSAPAYRGTADPAEHIFIFYDPDPGHYLSEQADTILTASGDERDSYVGWSISVGDQDADGLDDLLIGAPGCERYNEELGEVRDPGCAYLFYGAGL